MSETFPNLSEFTGFIVERWELHERRRKGGLPPWTVDPVLATYRFTNIRREDDRVTKWIHANWLHPYAKDPDVWFAMYVARIFNKPATLAALDYPVPWTPKKATRLFKACERLKAEDAKLFNAAYIVSTHRQACNSKHEFYVGIFNRLWQERAYVRPHVGDKLETFYERLKTQNGLGSFMTAQVVADVKHIAPLKQARDWWTFAHSGPGSRRGMCWLLGREPRPVFNETEWLKHLHELRALVSEVPGLPKLDSQNLQNCLCEADKYFRTKYAGKRPKQLFRVSAEKY